MIDFSLPILGFAAWSGTGKTTLLTQLIPLLTEQGLRVALLKHAHHNFSIDHKGKDSYRLREAGASQVVIASSRCIASIMDRENTMGEPSLEDALAATNPDLLDLVLVEGFKRSKISKIELHRQALGKPYLYPDDAMIIALAEDKTEDSNSNNTESEQKAIPRLDLNQPEEIALFIQQWLKNRTDTDNRGKE